LKFISENAPKIEPKTLKNAKLINKGCQICLKLSKIFKNNQIIKKIIVNFENMDKKVKVASGVPP